MSFFARNPLSEKNAKSVCASLQKSLVLLVDLSLVAKQAHWNVFGADFLSLHVKLDEVVATARGGSDTLAERIVQLGHAADGRVATVVTGSPLETYPDGFQNVEDTLHLVCDALHTTSKVLREAIEAVGDVDPLTQDQLIAICQQVEEQLWMLQSMEKHAVEKGSSKK